MFDRVLELNFSKRLISNAVKFDASVKEYKTNPFSEVKDGMVLCEIGVGIGVNLKYFPSDITYFGLEPNSLFHDLINREKKRVGLKNAEIFKSEAENIPLDDNSVDFVVSTFTFCSVKNQGKVFNEISRVLKPEGRLLFFEHIVSDSYLLRAVQYIMRPFSKILASNCDPTQDLLTIISKNGFKIIKIRYLNFKKSFFLNPNILGVAIKARTFLEQKQWRSLLGASLNLYCQLQTIN